MSTPCPIPDAMTPLIARLMIFLILSLTKDAGNHPAPASFPAHPQDQKSVPCAIRLRASTILWTSDAPSTSRAWRA